MGDVCRDDVGRTSIGTEGGGGVEGLGGLDGAIMYLELTTYQEICLHTLL